MHLRLEGAGWEETKGWETELFKDPSSVGLRYDGR